MRDCRGSTRKPDAAVSVAGLQETALLRPGFDFYGSRICIRSGAVVVPGGEAAEQ